MPIDPVKYSYNVVKPFSYETSTSPVGQRAHVNSTRNFGSHTLSGVTRGAVAGPYGAAAGAALGLAGDIWEMVASRQRAERANQESQKAAMEASARSSAEARAARNWNSEESQIRRMRMAGLSPGLAYGQMSPSTAQPAPQEKADVHKADTPKLNSDDLLRALQLLVQQQQADTALAAQQSSSALQGSQTQLNLIDSLTRNQANLANIGKILSDESLNDAQKNRIITLLVGEQNLLDAQAFNQNANARLSNADADVVENTGLAKAESEIARNNASANLSNQEAKALQLEYDINSTEWNNLKSFLAEYNFGDMVAPIALRAIRSLADNTGQTLNGILSNLTHISTKFGDWIVDYIDMFTPQVDVFDDESSESGYDKKRGSHSSSKERHQTHTRKRK